MSRIALILTLLVCGLGTGCTQYVHPLSPLEEAKADSSVFGSWYIRSADANGEVTHNFVHIGSANNPHPSDLDQNYFMANGDKTFPKKIPLENMTRVIVITMKPNGEANQMSFLGYPTHVEDRHYMNVPMIVNDKVAGYSIWKYEVNDDKLTVWNEVDEEVIKQLKKEGILHEKENSSIVSDNTQTLRKLFAEKDATLFPDQRKSTLQKLPVVN
ncbi:hypothetical protein [Blastopirellula marina]|uniref:Uncharacterized protein n=1 Tax=Blastopirellula marina TaxID=124 RepID=A0A2S8FHJ1_9BACT|nr:hypothetical protein [Blastopirellula marina]PQO31648.1 hypothetical protein C5Y98_19730 [Blastopirellula marina]PTL42955.1 hypothetical protein C5Y97_19740 [Blastopirellula marina]